MAMRKREDDEVYPNAAGIDVGASSHWGAVPRTADDQPVREFGTMTGDLHAMADWLLTCGVDTVALESTGVYWIPVYEVLERRGLTVWLVDARQMKYVPGRRRRASSKLSPHSCSQRLFICADRRHLDD
ncbi:transposase [Paraburkholderia sp. 35.1]